jgi:hypothetical protein
VLCCILIALLAPLGGALASWRAASGTADCCRAPVPWLTITLLGLGAMLVCVLLALMVLGPRPAAFRAWPICTTFGLQAGKPN